MTVPGTWRIRHQRYSLQPAVCGGCGQVIFPPRPVCPQCAEARRSGAAAWFALSVSPAGYDTPEMGNLFVEPALPAAHQVVG